MAEPEAAMRVRRPSQMNQARVLKYPLDLGNSKSTNQNFILFDVKEGGPRNRRSTNSLSTSHIALHIPPGALKTQYGGNYEELAGGRVFEESGLSLAGAGLGAALPTLITKNPAFALIGFLGGSAISSIARTVGGGLDEGESTGVLNEAQRATVAAGTLAANALSGALTPVTAGMGVAVNPHSSLIYRGPNAFREHGFTFDFWARERY